MQYPVQRCRKGIDKQKERSFFLEASQFLPTFSSLLPKPTLSNFCSLTKKWTGQEKVSWTLFWLHEKGWRYLPVCMTGSNKIFLKGNFVTQPFNKSFFMKWGPPLLLVFPERKESKMAPKSDKVHIRSSLIFLFSLSKSTWSCQNLDETWNIFLSFVDYSR